MAEIAGLVLGGIPIAIWALEKYAEPFEAYQNYRIVIETLRADLILQRRQLEVTLSSVGLESPSAVELQECFKAKFPRIHRELVIIIEQMGNSTAQLLKSLDIDINGKVSIAKIEPLTGELATIDLDWNFDLDGNLRPSRTQWVFTAGFSYGKSANSTPLLQSWRKFRVTAGRDAIVKSQPTSSASISPAITVPQSRADRNPVSLLLDSLRRPHQTLPTTPPIAQTSVPPPATIESIEDLCVEVQKRCASLSIIGCLEDPDVNNDRQFSHFSLEKTSEEFSYVTRTISLEHLLAEQNQQQMYAHLALSAKKRYGIAASVAWSVLHLSDSPWMGERWDQNEIKFFVGKTGKGQELLSQHPCTSYAFHEPTTMSQTQTRARDFDHLIPNKTIFTLGVILIELCLKTTLEELRQNFNGQVGDPDSVTLLDDYRTALNTLDYVYREAGDSYGNAVQSKCPAKNRRGMLVKREKHQGTSFVNATTVATTIKASNGSHMSISGIKFISQKAPKTRPQPKPITKDDLRAVQEGGHKRIAPKPQSKGRGTSIPYQSATDTWFDVSFSLELTKVWSEANEMQNSSLPSPKGITIPDWALHGLPVEISDEGKQCFHAYLFSCPIRQPPLEQLHIVAWQPLSMDQARFERLMLQPLTLRCTLSMGALFLLLKSGKKESAGLAMHSSRLCNLVNKLLGQKHRTLDEAMVLIQSVASLALLAAFLGLYDDWYAHIKGLKHLVDQAGGIESLPAPVQVLVEKADLRGACDILVMPLITPSSSRQTISKVLPKYHRNSFVDEVRRAVYEGKGHDHVCDAIQSLAMFATTIAFATSERSKIIFDPLALMDEYHSIEFTLLALPQPFQSHTEALDRCSHSNLASEGLARLPKNDDENVQFAKTSIQAALRISALFYLKLVRGGPPETLHGPVHMLQRLFHGYSKGALIWVCLVADLMVWMSIHEAWNFGSQKPDTSICRRAIPEGSTILIIGANSFTGSHVANQFLERGYKVRGTVRDVERNAWLPRFFTEKCGSDCFELVKVADMSAEHAFEQAVKGVSVVVHTAQNMSLSPNPNEVIPHVISGIVNGLKAAYSEPGVKRFIYTSSCATLYSPEREDDPGTVVTENTWNEYTVKQAWAPPPYTPDRGMVVYAASKTQAEQEVWKYHHEHRHERPDLVVNTVIPSLSLGKPLDPTNQGYSSTSGFIPLLLKGSTFPMHPFFPRQYYVHVQDSARLHVAAAILEDVKDQRIFAYSERLSWNNILAILRKARPDSTLPADFSNGHDPHKIVPRDKAEALLRILGRPGWIGLEECVKETIEGL
ncbi:hypothetical protein FSARC_7377 [Fusarium sarcochroum]|uniref:NAD-dependent epimerase/dehydratase domain-containing protein n=1 Tax=Fusarium sarcochroum TaxID=1208366 RepID=A0A8H4TVJ4_9HYPO|nr:hypothetical protein FSARC_7377 [Fusarium sarcochroum]